MANPHPKCEICRKRHAPGNCRAGGGPASPDSAQGIQCHSMPGFVANLARIFRELADLIERFPITTAKNGGER